MAAFVKGCMLGSLDQIRRREQMVGFEDSMLMRYLNNMAEYWGYPLPYPALIFELPLALPEWAS